MWVWSGRAAGPVRCTSSLVAYGRPHAHADARRRPPFLAAAASRRAPIAESTNPLCICDVFLTRTRTTAGPHRWEQRAGQRSMAVVAPRAPMRVLKDQKLQNWNLTESTAPAVAAFANSTEDVCAVVADKAAYPSPVLAVGSMHSVNACVSNNGTILNVAGMNRILGLEAHGVRAEAGVKLADLHDWLAKDDLEISFSPEIGDATVGSLAVTTSKDSSIDGPGYLSALVNEVKYVDEGGHVVTLSRAKTPTELLAFTCSYGMMGIVVEVVLGVRRRIPISTTAYCVPVKTGQAVASRLAELRTANDAMFAILVPDRSYVYVELRKKTSQLGGMLATNRALSLVATLGENELIKTIMMKTKYNCFLHGDPPSSAMSMLFAANRLPIFHFRSFFVNRYPSVTPGMRRLDFSFVEFDMATFDDVIAGCWEFHHAYKKRTGYAPTGYGIYFVDRGYGAVEGAPRKPTGNFSAPPGVSFMLDPITDDCDNPEWLEFNRDYTAWAVSKGAVPSLSQTKGLVKGQVVLPKALTRSRFLTPFYKEFVA